MLMVKVSGRVRLPHEVGVAPFVLRTTKVESYDREQYRQKTQLGNSASEPLKAFNFVSPDFFSF